MPFNWQFQPAEENLISHVHEAFHQKFHADFMVVDIQRRKYHVLNIVDLDTIDSERLISVTHEVETLRRLIKIHWILRHRAPESSSADLEFSRPV